MKLVFLGTRGNIEATNRRHRRHSSLLVTHRRQRVLIDCGTDWLGKAGRLRLAAIVVTHAHPDHVGGLRNGAPCPVHAARESWAVLRHYGIREGTVLSPRVPAAIRGITFEPFPVEHSLLAPAVGYRISAGGITFFYVPDLMSIPARAAALDAVRLYVGDGASLTRPILRRRGGAAIGHASIRDQLSWCKEEGVPRALFTHCGTQIVAGDEAAVASEVHAVGRDLGVEAGLAHDGMTVVLRPRVGDGPRGFLDS